MLEHGALWLNNMPPQSIFWKQKQLINILSITKKELGDRLRLIHEGFQKLKNEGFNVESIAPQAAIYLTIQIDLIGKKPTIEKILEKQTDVTEYILNEAKLAVVPFYAFGSSKNSNWYRLSVGTCKKEEINDMLSNLKQALKKLK